MRAPKRWGALTAIALVVLGACSSTSSAPNTDASRTTTTPPSTPSSDTTTTTTSNPAALLIGRWLGPEPGLSQEQCANGTTEYTFKTDGTWSAHNVNVDACGGTFTIGGTYTFGGTTLVFHYTQCPQSCAPFPDSSETISFIDNNNFSMADASFSGTYHRQ